MVSFHAPAMGNPQRYAVTAGVCDRVLLPAAVVHAIHLVGHQDVRAHGVAVTVEDRDVEMAVPGDRVAALDDAGATYDHIPVWREA